VDHEILVQRTLPDQIKNRDSIRHGLVSLASIFTIGRLLCGVFSVVSTFRGMHLIAEPAGLHEGLLAFDDAACAVFWGILCDGLDGPVARLTGRASDFGRELDSLVDVLTFGMAPTLLAMFWGVEPVQRMLGSVPSHLLSAAGWAVGCGFLLSGVGRLARFNLMAEQKGNHGQAVGLAIPCAAAVVAAVIHFARRPPDSWQGAVAWLALMALLSLLMVSRTPYETLHSFPSTLRRATVLFPLGGFLLWAVWYHSVHLLLIAAVGYAVSGPLVYAAAFFRSRSTWSRQ
jgi:CDP-diacylglycerol---serine O-phosphatidyltransferase